jgi:hypothetical protein
MKQRAAHFDELVASFIFQSRSWQIWQDYTEMNGWNRKQSRWNLKTVKNFPNLLASAEVAERMMTCAGLGFCYLLLFMFLIPFYNTKLGKLNILLPC